MQRNAVTKSQAHQFNLCANVMIVSEVISDRLSSHLTDQPSDKPNAEASLTLIVDLIHENQKSILLSNIFENFTYFLQNCYIVT
jgi:hypothetical protein